METDLAPIDYSWADRPSSEDIVQALETWFPTCAADSPVARASNAHTSSTTNPSYTAERALNFNWVRGEFIGKGAYGRVYLARNISTCGILAVKQAMLPNLSDTHSHDPRLASITDKLRSQYEMLKDSEHRNIVRYIGLEETSTTVSLFMEYVPGGSIGSIRKKHGRFDENITRSFAYQILNGLQHLHMKGILHREIRGANILVDLKGVCKISDSGCMSYMNEDVTTEGVQAPVFWLAPEVVNPSGRRFDSKVDIWSFGCVVLEMWTGERPWAGEEAMSALVNLHTDRQRPPIPQDLALSELADGFREACFASDPGERFDAAALRHHPYLELPPDWTFAGFTDHNDAN